MVLVPEEFDFVAVRRQRRSLLSSVLAVLRAGLPASLGSERLVIIAVGHPIGLDLKRDGVRVLNIGMPWLPAPLPRLLGEAHSVRESAITVLAI